MTTLTLEKDGKVLVYNIVNLRALEVRDKIFALVNYGGSFSEEIKGGSILILTWEAIKDYIITVSA